VSGRSCLECRPEEARLLEAAQHEHPGAAFTAEPFDELQPSRLATDPDVADDDVRPRPLDELDGGVDVRRPSDDLDSRSGSSGVGDGVENRRMIVDDRESDHGPRVAGNAASA
jgi:hypothetical protein